MAFNLGDALKGVSELGTGREQIEYIRLDLIDEDPNNFYQLSDIDQLAANIELCGLQQPIRVRPIENTDRYMIVSGHRRRKAIEMLANDNPEKWNEVSCIIERDEASPALQQLRLIFANSSTRTMTPSEVSEQAVQVEKLLYQLKEEEGYEFPGRMRDHVAQVVGVSKSKLARLKVIRGNLDECWMSYFESNNLHESTAYYLSQLPKEEQFFIYDYMEGTKGSAFSVSAAIVEAYKNRIEAVSGLLCPTEGFPCDNIDNKREATIRTGLYDFHPCGKCCASCHKLTNCRYACPKLADQIAQQKAELQAESRRRKAADAEKDAPAIEAITRIWRRFGKLRRESGVSVDSARKMAGYSCAADTQFVKFEQGELISAATSLPFGSILRSDVDHLVELADSFGCSLDYLLCRTDVKEMAQDGATVSYSDTDKAEPEFIPGTWHPASVEPPVGVPLVMIDSDWFVDNGKYRGCGDYTMNYGSPVIWWTLEPDPSASTAAPAVTGWRSGTPEAYGTYAAYVKVAGAANPMLRELLWTGDEWLMFGQKISEDVTVQCWADRPEF